MRRLVALFFVACVFTLGQVKEWLMARQARTGQDVTFEANADLSTLQFTAVKLVAGPAGGDDARVDASTGRSHGILQNKPPAAGQGAVIRTSGFSKFKVDGSGTPIAAGDPLKVTTGGVGVKAVADKDPVLAYAAAASTAAGDIIEVMIQKFDLAV
jgi:hypothetical protein